MTVERDWFWFWFWFYYALWLASVFTLVLVLRQSSENRSIQFHLIGQMLAKVSGVESEGTVSEFRKRTRNFLCCVHLLRKAGA